MTALDYSIGTSRTPLNIQPGIQNYFLGRQDKRAQAESDIANRQQEKQRTIADFVINSMTPDGELDRKSLASKLLNKGWIEEHNKIKSDLIKQDQDIAKASQEKSDRDAKRMGGFADYYVGAEDKRGAYKTMLQAMQQERIDIPAEWGPEPTPEIDQAMNMLSARFGNRSEKASQPKPDFVKGNNGNYWAALPDGSMKDTGTPFYQEPKEPSQGLILQVPGQVPMVVKGGVATPIQGAPVIPDKSKEGITTGDKIPGLVPIPGVEITKDSVKKVKDAAQAYDEVKRQLEGLRDLYSGKVNPKTGKREGGTGTELAGEKARTLASKLRQIQLTLKGPEFLELGVLAGPDMSLLDEMIGDPTSLANNFKSVIPFMGDPVAPQLDELEKFIDGRYYSALQRNGFKVGSAANPQAISSEGPQEGQIKQNANGDTVIYQGGKWQLAK